MGVVLGWTKILTFFHVLPMRLVKSEGPSLGGPTGSQSKVAMCQK